jgi:TPR repeat protein
MEFDTSSTVGGGSGGTNYSALISGDLKSLWNLYKAGEWQKMVNYKWNFGANAAQRAYLLTAIAHAKVGDYQRALELSDYGVSRSSWHTDDEEEKEFRTIAFQEAVQAWEKANGRTMTKADLIKGYEAYIYKAVTIHGIIPEGLKATWEALTGNKMTSADEKRIRSGGKGLFGKKPDYSEFEKIPARSVLPQTAKTASSSSSPSAEEIFNQGMDAYEAEDYAKAVELWHKSADMGNDNAQNALGNCYLYGNGVPQDDKKAAEWYRKSADQGHEFAQNNLAMCYYNGNGVPQDFKKAAEWFRKSADQGYDEAQNNLGNCYYNGEGVPEDYKKAAEWYRKAAEQEHEGAQENLDNMKEQGLI